MGRISKPQKSRKHKKVKAIDPFYTGSRKLDRDSGNVNLDPAPEEVDDQAMPSSFKEMMKLKEDLSDQNGKFKRGKRKKKKHEYADEAWVEMPGMERGMSRPLKPVPEFIQRKKESEEKFLRRVERETQAVITRSKLEDKYKINIEQGPGGKIEVTAHKRKKNTKSKERLKLKKEKKREKLKQVKHDKRLGFESLTDQVKFGEVAMQPPDLQARPRKSTASSDKPGRKSLLLKEMFEKEKSQPLQRQVGKTIKRKHLAPVRQRIIDEERDRAVELYREMKHKKHKLG